MNSTTNTTSSGDLSWFSTWFDSSHYHTLYANRNEKEAASFIDALVSELNPHINASVIDVGCGSGRHCRQLAAKGLQVTGIDLAFSSIKKAKKYETGTLHFLQHDMRNGFGKNTFDYVFNFFTNFGYFKNADENDMVIGNMARALKPGGTLVLDYLNVAHSEKRLVTKELKEIDGTFYHIHRWMDTGFFYKQISFQDKNIPQPVEYIERVAKLRVEDFKRMLALNDMKLNTVYGDYSLNSYDKHTSPRLILVAEKANLRCRQGIL